MVSTFVSGSQHIARTKASKQEHIPYGMNEGQDNTSMTLPTQLPIYETPGSFFGAAHEAPRDCEAVPGISFSTTTTDSIHNTAYTGRALAPIEIGHPIVRNRNIACIPGMDDFSSRSPSPTSAASFPSDFSLSDDAVAEKAQTPISAQFDPVDRSDGSADAQHVEVTRTKARRTMRRAMMEEEEAEAEPSGMSSKRKRTGRPEMRDAKDVVSDEVLTRTGPVGRRMRADKRGVISLTLPAPVPSSSTRPNIDTPSPLSSDDSESEEFTHGNQSPEVEVDEDAVGTWVQGYACRTDSAGRKTYSIHSKRSGKREWMHPCLEKDHRGGDCGKAYTSWKDLVRHIRNYGKAIICGKCRKEFSRLDALRRHQRESCVETKGKKTKRTRRR